VLPEEFTEGREIDKNTLKQARKVLMAEFELQGQATIFIHEREYDKDGVLKFFENLETDANFEFHRFIFQDKPLLRFLEKGDIESYTAAVNTIIDQKEKNDLAFISFIAPYVNFYYNKLLYNALRNNLQNDLSILLNQNFPLSTEYEAAAYQLAYRWYHQKMREVETIEQELLRKEFVAGSRIYALVEPSFIVNFNRMSMYFFDIRDKYAFKLYEIVVLLNNEYKRTELARSVLDEGIKLNVDEQTHHYYVQADKVIEQKEAPKNRYNWLVFYVIAQILFVLIRVSTCNTPSRPTYDFPIETHQPKFNHTFDDTSFYVSPFKNLVDLEELEKLDSMVKALEKYNSVKMDSTSSKKIEILPSDLSKDTLK
jgi:plasmid maintenance system killer protein